MNRRSGMLDRGNATSTGSGPRDAGQFLEARLRRLAALSWQEASRLPESSEERVCLGASECVLATFRQARDLPTEKAVLVTLQLTRSRCFGAWGDPLEKGLVFVPGQPPREATAAELLEPGDLA